MNENKTYVSILLDSLIKKDHILEALILLTEEQSIALMEFDELDMDAFNGIMDKKEHKLKELNSIDQGFELIYEKVKEVLVYQKDQFETEIKQMQVVITKITEKGVKLETLELENKRKVEMYFAKKRKQIKNFQLSNKTVTSYYKNMTANNEDSSFFVDKRK